MSRPTDCALAPCPCGEQACVTVRIPASRSASGETERRTACIDRCLADLVRALQAAGIDTCASCCGHGETCGHIALQDGRDLLVLSPEQAAEYETDWGIAFFTAEAGRRAHRMLGKIVEARKAYQDHEEITRRDVRSEPVR